MGFTKPIPFIVQEEKQLVLTFHDVVGISWSFSTQIVSVTVGSWLSQNEYQAKLDPKQMTSISYPDILNFIDVTKIIDFILNDPESVFNGGVTQP